MYIIPLLYPSNNQTFTAKAPKIDLDLAKKYMAENRTQEELADVYGVSISVISRQLKHLGVKWKRAGKIPLNELKKLVERGDKIVDIANLYNCSPSRVSNLIISNGISKNNPKSTFEIYFKKILANEITQKDVAKILNKTPETIRRWMKDLVGTGKKAYNQITVLELLKKGYTNAEITEILGVAKVTVKNVRYKYKKELTGFETSIQAEKSRYRTIVNENSEKILNSIKNRDSIQVIASELGVPKSFVEDYLMSPDVKPLYRKTLFSNHINEKLSLIKDKIEKGLDVKAISKEMGVTSATIYRYLRMTNINKKVHKQTILSRYNDVIEPIVEKYTNGTRVADICRELNLPASQVNSILMHLGLKQPRHQ